MSNERDIDYREILKGKTLTVYFFLLGHSQPTKASEIQLGTKLSSLSLVSYHLDKLMKAGLVEENSEGGYSATRVVRTGVLRFFVGSGRLLLPRHLFYALFATSFLVSSLALLDWVFSSTFILLMAVLVIVTCIFWLETVLVWRSRPLV